MLTSMHFSKIATFYQDLPVFQKKILISPSLLNEINLAEVSKCLLKSPDFSEVLNLLKPLNLHIPYLRRGFSPVGIQLVVK